MASREIKIPVSAEIRAEKGSLERIQQVLQTTLNNAGQNTSFANNIRKSLAEIQPLIERYGQLTIQPEIDASGLRELESIAKKVYGAFDKTMEQGHYMDLGKMVRPEFLELIKQYTQQIALLDRELAKVEKHGAGGKATDWLRSDTSGYYQTVDTAARRHSAYKPDATLEQNVTNLSNASSAASARAVAIGETLGQLQQACVDAQAVADQVEAELRALEATVPDIQKQADVASFASAITKIKGTSSAAQDMLMGTPIKEIGTTLHQFGDAGYIKQSYRELATRFFQSLGMGVEQAAQLSEGQIDRDIVPALQRHFNIDESNMRTHITESGGMLTLLREAGQEFGRILQDTLTQAQAAGMGSDVEGITGYARKKQGELTAAQGRYKTASRQASEAYEEFAGAEAAQQEAIDLSGELMGLANALSMAAASVKEFRKSQIIAEKAQTEQDKIEAEALGRKSVTDALEGNAPDIKTSRTRGKEAFNAFQAELDTQAQHERDAQEFSGSMKNAVKQWMSLSQIVNIVKNGIRTAYQDIQGLDKAMTNIAVVTDMSVSDLWGKINEYMSIAQQYGVTTQGVYEVSQLYYQQGLSTGDVMAATTETLKLARIAGMGYAEAADAMTVAIRSFKMEMTDASHVTDVYSKVAAITASDSEELAIAMSKTASSAESVGSSFENTTAMLAVMIETTRESAQNLGSALKSIISRYGEMKVGLTVDSEGEDIDYNKVDTALKSVGISIKDAQGQFRDFDDVIFELSEKWDSLDKNTQRYIATIMAGNRQQSRFIALVDNWDRLKEVSTAAEDSEDAGLLQYSKTLDSLETKLNNIKTSFQEFYMNILNGPFIGGLLEGINKVIKAFNKLGAPQTILNVVMWIRTIKQIAGWFINKFGATFKSIARAMSGSQEQAVSGWAKAGAAAGRAFGDNFNANNTANGGPSNEEDNDEGGSGDSSGDDDGKEYKYDPPKGGLERFLYNRQNNESGKLSLKGNSWGTAARGAKVAGAFNAVGSVLSLVSTSTANSNAAVSTWANVGGNALKGAELGAMLGPWGAAAGALLGAAVSLHEVADIEAKQAQIDYEEAKEKVDKSNIERAEAKEQSSTLSNLIKSYKNAEKNKYNSEEDYQTWIDVNNQLAEKYPTLIEYMDAEGNAIIDITQASELLSKSLKETHRATVQYYKDQTELIKAEQKKNEVYGYDYGSTWERWWQGLFDKENMADSDVARIAMGNVGDAWEATKGLVGAERNVTVADLYKTYGDLSQYLGILDKSSDIDPNALVGNTGMTYAEVAKGLQDLGVIQESNGVYTLEEHAKAYRPEGISNDIMELEYEGATQLINILSQMTELDNEMASSTEGFEKVVHAFLNQSGLSDVEISALTKEEYERLMTPFIEFYDALSYKNQQIFNSLINDLGSYSYKEINKIIRDMGLNDSTPEGKAILSLWKQQASSNLYRAINFVDDQNDYGYQIQTYSQFKTTNANSGYTESEMEEAYWAYLNAQASIYKRMDPTGEYSYLLDAAPEEQEAWMGMLSREEIKTESSNYLVAQFAKRRKELLHSDINTLMSGDGEVFGGAIDVGLLDDNQRNELFALMTAENVGTDEWFKQIQEFARNAGQEIDEIEAQWFEQIVLGNFVTKTQQAVDGIKKILSDLKDYSEKQTKGFTLEDAQSILATIQKIDPNASLESLFEVTEDGTLVLKDFDASMGKIYQARLTEINKLQDSAQEALNNVGRINAASFDRQFESGLFDISDKTMVENFVKPIAEALNFDTDQTNALVGAIQSGAITNYETFVKWLETQAELLNLSEEYIQKQYTKLMGSTALDKFLTDKGKDKEVLNLTTKVSGLDMASFKDLATDYDFTPEEQAAIEAGTFDWDTYFDLFFKELDFFGGVNFDEFGNITITDPEKYAQFLIDKYGITDPAQVESIRDGVWAAYEEQWADEQQQIENWFKKSSFSEKELRKIYAIADDKQEGETFEQWAQRHGFEQSFDGTWKVIEGSEDLAYEAIADFVAEKYNWAAEQLPQTKEEWAAFLGLQNKITAKGKIDFVKKITPDASWDTLDDALEKGLITQAQYAANADALLSGELSVYDFLISNIDFSQPGMKEAFLEGQAAYSDKVKSELETFFQDGTFTSEEIMKIWNKVGNGVDFATWAEQAGFIYDEGVWKATAESWEALQEYVRKNYGAAYLELIPKTQEEFETMLGFEKITKKTSPVESIGKISRNMGLKELQNIVTSLELTLTEDEIAQAAYGIIPYYKLLYNKIIETGNAVWIQAATQAMKKIEAELVAALPAGEIITSFEQMRTVASTLLELGFSTTEIESMLDDSILDIEDMQLIMRKVTGDAELAGAELIQTFQAYGISLENLFKTAIETPAQILAKVDADLNSLTVEQYDAYIAAYSDRANEIYKLFEGTGTAVGAKRLQALLNTNLEGAESYELPLVRTAEGLQINREAFIQVLTGLRETDLELYNLVRDQIVQNPTLLNEKLTDVFGVLESIRDIHEEINQLSSQQGEDITKSNKLLQEQLSLYSDIYRQMSMTKSDGWDFLSGDLEGNAENFLTFVDTMREGLGMINNKDGVDPEGFLKMLQTMQAAGVPIETLSSSYKNWGDLMLDAFSYAGEAIATGTNVNLADMDLSADKMTAGMGQFLKSTAENQIKLLDAQIAMVEGLMALEGIGEPGKEGTFGSVAKTIENSIASFNAAIGYQAIDISTLRIRVGGKEYPLTEEGMNQAYTENSALFGNNVQEFLKAIGVPFTNGDFVTTLNNGAVIDVGKNPPKLDNNTEAVVGTLETTNSILKDILAELQIQQAINNAQAQGKDLTKKEDAEQFIRGNASLFFGDKGLPEGALGRNSLTNEQIEDLSPALRAIWEAAWSPSNQSQVDEGDTTPPDPTPAPIVLDPATQALITESKTLLSNIEKNTALMARASDAEKQGWNLSSHEGASWYVEQHPEIFGQIMAFDEMDTPGMPSEARAKQREYYLNQLHPVDRIIFERYQDPTGSNESYNTRLRESWNNTLAQLEEANARILALSEELANAKQSQLASDLLTVHDNLATIITNASSIGVSGGIGLTLNGADSTAITGLNTLISSILTNFSGEGNTYNSSINVGANYDGVPAWLQTALGKPDHTVTINLNGNGLPENPSGGGTDTNTSSSGKDGTVIPPRTPETAMREINAAIAKEDWPTAWKLFREFRRDFPDQNPVIPSKLNEASDTFVNGRLRNASAPEEYFELINGFYGTDTSFWPEDFKAQLDAWRAFQWYSNEPNPEKGKTPYDFFTNSIYYGEGWYYGIPGIDQIAIQTAEDYAAQGEYSKAYEIASRVEGYADSAPGKLAGWRLLGSNNLPDLGTPLEVWQMYQQYASSLGEGEEIPGDLTSRTNNYVMDAIRGMIGNGQVQEANSLWETVLRDNPDLQDLYPDVAAMVLGTQEQEPAEPEFQPSEGPLVTFRGLAGIASQKTALEEGGVTTVTPADMNSMAKKNADHATAVRQTGTAKDEAQTTYDQYGSFDRWSGQAYKEIADDDLEWADVAYFLANFATGSTYWPWNHEHIDEVGMDNIGRVVYEAEGTLTQATAANDNAIEAYNKWLASPEGQVYLSLIGEAPSYEQVVSEYNNASDMFVYQAQSYLYRNTPDDPTKQFYGTQLREVLDDPRLDQTVVTYRGLQLRGDAAIAAAIETSDWEALPNILNTVASQVEDTELQTKLTTLANSTNTAAQSLDQIANVVVTVPNVTIAITTTTGTSTTSGDGEYTGNVSGLAFADGNAKLIAGANLAGKTLVGELGPELAVYDGMYHLLGQNGAEFVDIPSDAIIFNHRQTEGILNGQMGFRGTAMAEGNVSGPAYASGLAATLDNLKQLRAMWQKIASMSVDQLVGAGGGGGGGNSLTASTAQLQEWYNLSRQIANVEQEINNLIAERENIAKDNGEKYLQNLRETQRLLEKQKLTQQVLLDYQQQQLKRQGDFINEHKIWSQFLTVTENGLLQYIDGNEANGGKGALSVLDQMNKMSGKQQERYIKSLGYSYTDADGKKLKGKKLIEQFFKELQDQINQYDELYDTVNESKQTIEELITKAEEINEEIIENQKKLEENIYDILVKAWEKEIEALREQTDLIKKANESYVNGIKEALSTERNQYKDNKEIADREALQRQLSLLRRSGGSASEIAELEEKLDETLKEEYFRNQERMIENIEEANKEQLRKLEEQIRLQEEGLKYQKENGVLWTKVYEILSGTKDDILSFMSGNYPEFFSQSVLKQEEMLTDWAKMVGIYTEERQYENHTKVATSIWDSNDLWNGEILKGMEDRYKGLKDNQKESLKKLFTDTYANSMINGATEDESRKLAEEEVKKYLNQAYDEKGNLIEETEPVKSPSGSTKYVSVSYTVTPAEAKTAGCSISGPSRVAVGSEKGGLKLKTARGWDFAGLSSSDSSVASYSSGAIKAHKKGSITFTAKFVPSNSTGETKMNYHSGVVESDAIIDSTGTLSETISNFGGFKITDGKTVLQDSGEKYKTKKLATAAAKTALNSIDKKKHPKAKYTLYGFSQGGLVDYTGLAMVHGTQSKPEAFLNADQTAQIKEALQATNGKENLLKGLHSTIAELRSLIHSISTIDNSTNYDISIAPGAVVIQVEQLANNYDVERLSNDIMNRMVSIASKTTNRGINRR